jgi:acetolactate synthase-1/2/3 large subunit
MSEISGAEIIVKSLLKEKVEVIFGIPGGAVLPLFDKLYDSPIRVILTRHEQGAVHMADGYARATGKVGVAVTTSGPGATNTVTALATAYMDSIPLVVITGQVATHLIGNDAFQEADTTGITRPVTKHNYLVKDVKALAKTIHEAFYIASTGRQGPVLIDIPVDIQRATAEFVWEEKIELRSYQPTYKGHPLQIKKLSEAINAAERPILYVGGGVIASGASEELVMLSKKCDIPVTTTLMALGAYPPDSELYLGMLGMHGSYAANMSMQNADLIIAIGARFDDRCTGKLSSFAPKAKNIAHIDIDPTSISKNVPATIPVVGDAKLVLKDLLKLCSEKKHHGWRKQIDEWKKKYPLTYKQDDKLRPQYVVEKISELTNGEAIVTTEVGQNQMWAAQFYKVRYPRHFITSGGLGTMGYGFPAAIGAKVGVPDKIVIDIAGDGSFQMNIQELATAVCNNIGVIVAILNNSYLGMVRQWQQMFYGRRYSATCLRRRPWCPPQCSGPNKSCPNLIPDFVKLAESYGAIGYRVSRKEEVEPILKKAIKDVTDTRKKSKAVPVVIDFIVEPEECVLPMVPAGASLDEIITSLA